MRRRSTLAAPIIFASLCILPIWANPAAAQADGASNVEAYLQHRLRHQPNDAAAWRMLGRIRLDHGDFSDAVDSLRRALSLDGLSAAAHFDLARALVAADERAEAAAHFHSAIELAPESEYAREADRRLDLMGESTERDPFSTVGFQTRSFDGSLRAEATTDSAEEAVAPADEPAGFFSRFDLRLEMGARYNSNVALAPISRELAPGNLASFQFLLAPELEVRLLDGPVWSAGAGFASDFTFNEGNFDDLNLQSYRPGAFLERIFLGERIDAVGRVAYEFSHDEFGSQTFGDRHALVASTAVFWSGEQSSFGYWSIDHTDFLADGALPTVTSRDGWTNALGLSHETFWGWGALDAIRAGADVEFADTVGSDFRYGGFSLYVQPQLILPLGFECDLDAGWGYRDYDDYEFTPSRNEHVWRAGAELRRRLTDHLLISGRFQYDRFDSANPLFAADRYLTGAGMTLEY